MVLMVSSSSLSLFFIPFFCFFLCYGNSTNTSKGLVVTEKTRLGSRPPSCHNRCNQCRPCYAVQVPFSMPTQTHRLPQGSTATVDNLPADAFYTLPGNRHSNYKPLGWKCRCGNHVYNA